MDGREILDLVGLNERSHRVRSETGEPITVIENPSRDQFRSLLANGPVKGLLSPRDRLFVWSAANASSDDIVEAFSLDKIVSIHLDMTAEEAVVIGSSRHYREKASEAITTSAAMHRLYWSN